MAVLFNHRWIMTFCLLAIYQNSYGQDVESIRKKLLDETASAREKYLQAYDKLIKLETDPDRAEALIKEKKTLAHDLTQFKIPRYVPTSLLDAKREFKQSISSSLRIAFESLKEVMGVLTRNGKYEAAREAKSLYQQLEQEYKNTSLYESLYPRFSVWKGTGRGQQFIYNIVTQRREESWYDTPCELKVKDCSNGTITVEINAEGEIGTAKLKVNSDTNASGPYVGKPGMVEMQMNGDIVLIKYMRGSHHARFSVKVR